MNTAFCNALIVYRHAAGLTRAALEDLTDISQSHLCRLERGQREPTPAILARLVPALAPTRTHQDRLWLLAGYVPPDLDPDALLPVLTRVRTHTAGE